ncbi:MAG: hypothetical protein M3539_04045 [Acidobacteriota bacterium]|nr:hypothetical protein [Acidobacteriota bacterium]
MIPQRVLTAPIFGNGLRERVTACRRRLRVKRVTHKTHGGAQREELIPVADSSEFPVASLAVRQSELSVNPSPALPIAALETLESLELVVEQEVGIT